APCKNEMLREEIQSLKQQLSEAKEELQKNKPSFSVDQALSNKKEKYECRLCEKSFKRPQNLKQHMFTHTDERPHVCSVCAKSFKCKYDLVNHMKRHSDVRAYTCMECGSSFKTACDRLRHVRIHKKHFKCEKCDRGYENKSTLDNHMLIAHGSDRPFQCTECGRCFRTKGSINRHMDVHGKKPGPVERQFKCEVCQKIVKD
ncbi:hypothetical protein SK128_012135, partial [Halocaridina rubra]